MTELALFGRHRETRMLNDLVDGRSDQGALIVRGEAGVGKSSLLLEASRRARDRGIQVLAGGGVQSETDLPFAGLHQLLRPLFGGIEELPAPQRAALLAAFGMSDAAAPDRFLIALASLELLAESAAHSPLLLVVEDAQWLDRPTGDVLAFIGRRLGPEEVTLLVAIREGYVSPLDEVGLPELLLEGLERPAAAALLDARATGLAVAVRERLLKEAAGNPLALVELPAALGSSRLSGGETLPEQLPLTARLERAFAERAAELPEATRRLLLVAAVDGVGDLGEVLGAAAIGGSGVTIETPTPAVSAGLIEVEDTNVRFRHPLMRSAIVQAASDSERRTAHAAMAEVLAGQPDRAVWHRAASTVGQDEGVASELEAAAVRAQRRGGGAVAVAALERAAKLSDGLPQRAGRLLRAIWIAFEFGRHDLVVRLLQEVEPQDLDSREQARLTWLQEVFLDGLSGGAARVRFLVGLGEQMRQDGDTHLALQFLRAAAMRCWAGDELPETRDVVVAAVERLPIPENHPELIAILALAAPVEQGAVVIDRLSRLKPEDHRDPETMRLLGTAATAVSAFDLSGPFLSASVAGLRSQGRLGLLAQALVSEAFSAISMGDWDIAAPSAAEAGRLARETAQPFWGAGAQIAEATLAALQGKSEEADLLAAEAERVTLPMGVRSNLALLQIARGLSALGRGDFADGYEHLRRIFDPADLAYHPIVRCWAIGDLAEAAVYAGYRDAARAAIDDLRPLAELSPARVLHAGLLYARSLVAEDDDAEALYQASLSADLSLWPFLRGRMLLAYGMWLRRRRRVAESRTPLRAALVAFDTFGAIPWGERARQELLASGERSRRRSPEAWALLTPQELQIAKMTAEGLSNKEIGQRLYVSHRTVGSHLYRIFPKLGITSRSELKTVLGDTLVRLPEASPSS